MKSSNHWNFFKWDTKKVPIIGKSENPGFSSPNSVDAEEGGNNLQCMSSILLLIPLILMLFLSLTPGISMSEDLGRHLLLGRIICETKSIPETNFLTYTCPDFPFINHHWLSEVILFLGHKLGGLNALLIAKACIMTITLFLAMTTTVPRRSSALYLFTCTLAAVTMAFRAHIRPELITYLGVALFGWLLTRIDRSVGRKKTMYWLCLIAYGWFWANAHIYFIFGIGMVGAYVLSCYIVRAKKSHDLIKALPRKEAVALLLLTGMCCVNPNGVKGLFYPLTIFNNYGVAITENRSPLELWETVVNPMLLALPFLSLIGLYAMVRGVRQPIHALSLTRMIIVVTALISSWMMARSAPLLALTLPPLLGGILIPTKPEFLPLRIIRHLAVVLLQIGLIYSVLEGAYYRIFPSPIGPTPFGLDDESRYMALHQLQEKGLPEPIFCDYNIGSLVEYNLYPAPSYVDNRPEAFPAAFWENEYIPSLALTERWHQTVAERDIKTVIVSLTGVGEGFVSTMTRNPDWQLVHLDFLCAVWIRNDAMAAQQNPALTLADIEQYRSRIERDITQLDSQPFWKRQIVADQLIYEIYSLICIGSPDKAWPLIWQIHLRYPDYQIVHELLRVCAPSYATESIEHILKQQSRFPLAAKQILDYGRVLEQAGRTNEAHRLYRHGRLFFPLNMPLQKLLTTEKSTS
ncbi:MAG: hypothetical protein EOL87_17580 [Spartobacteria bacterium]|nr:hypothetical protein [Spartobacteria bacterium]